MKKHLAYYETEWPVNIAELTAVENKPFVGYLKGEGVSYTVVPTKPKLEYKMVDLGLPSGLLWADRNVGATSEYDYGLYFQWGDTKGYTKEQVEAGEVALTFDSYFDTTNSGNTFNKYDNNGGLTVLESVDDAAAVHMGTDWRMPTISDLQELIDNTTCTIVQSDGITEITFEDLIQNYLMPNIDFTGALKCTSKINNNSILIAPNLRSFMAPEDSGAALWLSELSDPYGDCAIAGTAVMHSCVFSWERFPRYMPMPVRGVRMPEGVIPEPVTGPADNEIWYTSSNWNIINPSDNTGFGANLLNNVYINKGVYSFDGSITSIGNYAFNGCSSLTSITIPDSVTNIGHWAFAACSSLTSIVIPNGVTDIKGYAFRNCSSLTSITIPEGVNSIGSFAFQGCSSLTSMIVESGNTKYDSRENCNAIIETTSNTLIAGCQNTIIPDSVTSIGDGAFGNCSSLTSITIPNSITRIGDSAFSSCKSLISATIPESVTSIGAEAFKSCISLTSITFEGTMEEWKIISKGFYWNNNVPATYVQCTDGQVTL